MTDKHSRPDAEQAFYTVAQAADDWQCSTKKVRRIIKKGDLIAHKFDGQIRIGHADKKDYERRKRMG